MTLRLQAVMVAVALCWTAAAQGVKREEEWVERVKEVKKGKADHSAKGQSGGQRHGRAVRDGAPLAPPPDRTAASRVAAAGRSAATGHRVGSTKKLQRLLWPLSLSLLWPLHVAVGRETALHLVVVLRLKNRGGAWPFDRRCLWQSRCLLDCGGSRDRKRRE